MGISTNNGNLNSPSGWGTTLGIVFIGGFTWVLFGIIPGVLAGLIGALFGNEIEYQLINRLEIDRYINKFTRLSSRIDRPVQPSRSLTPEREDQLIQIFNEVADGDLTSRMDAENEVMADIAGNSTR